MSERTKGIAAEIAKPSFNTVITYREPVIKIPLELEQFVGDVEEHLKAIKNEAGNSIVHKGLVNSEVREFIEDNFPEISDQNGFMQLLQKFGFRRGMIKSIPDFFTDAYLFYDLRRTGFLMIQTPPASPLNTVQNAIFSLLYQKDYDNRPTFDLSGVNDRKILTASYVLRPEIKGYALRKFSVTNNPEVSLQPFVTLKMAAMVKGSKSSGHIAVPSVPLLIPTK